MDEETKAMGTLVGVLEGLEEGARMRVIRWLAERFGVGVAGAGGRSAARVGEPRVEGEREFAELFAQADAGTGTERVLVAAYYLQEVMGRADLDSQSMNNLLKELGHGVSNVTRSLDLLMESRPKLVIQTRKSGKTKQARKKYRVTDAGTQKVKEMLTRAGSAA